MNKLMCVLGICVILIISFTADTLAMPEYSTRLGEPCGTCHVSAAGGGLRTPRGQAWVAQEKGNTIPTLEESLQVLGVKLKTDPADYAAPKTTPPAPEPLRTRFERTMLFMHLLEYEGN